MTTEVQTEPAVDSAEEFIASEATVTASDSVLAKARDTLLKLKSSVCAQVMGRDDVIDLVIIALIADGHVLLEDFPGSGKTTLAKALGESIHGNSTDAESNNPIAAFRRIQFTPDLLPSDVTGVSVFDTQNNDFYFRHGPVFAHVLLADEINRTSPKVQASLLEAMGEKQVTVDNKTYALGALFFVIATQNPLDMAGTYPLPTPQLDRFLFKITMAHIDRDAELNVLDTYKQRRHHDSLSAGVSHAEVLQARQIIEDNVAIHPAVKTALVDISRKLRSDDRVLQGNSTRSMVLLMPALQVSAALQGRDYVSAHDIELLLPRVLEHRIELAPGVSDFKRVLEDCMSDAMEQFARSIL